MSETGARQMSYFFFLGLPLEAPEEVPEATPEAWPGGG